MVTDRFVRKLAVLARALAVAKKRRKKMKMEYSATVGMKDSLRGINVPIIA